MRLTDIVNQLQSVLPKYTDLFSTLLSIDTISATATTATITTTTDHNLANNYAITIVDVGVNTIIDTVSKDGLVYTFTTTTPHDLTLGYPGYEQVQLGGFTDSAWNVQLNLLDVIDRYTFKVQSVESLPTLNTQEYLNEIRIDGVNGRFAVTVLSTTQFTITGDFSAGTYTGGIVKAAVRIAGSTSIQRSLDQYTKQKVEDLWMFVSTDTAVVSKDRHAYNDAVATFASNEDIRLRLVDSFSVYLVKNTTDDIAAVEAEDTCRHELLSPILKSLLGAKFDTGLSGKGDFAAVLKGHNALNYTRAILVYQYSFEFSQDIILSDSVEPSDSRAFSDIEYTNSIGTKDTTDMSVDINLR